jgi:hypothetical protein
MRRTFVCSLADLTVSDALRALRQVVVEKRFLGIGVLFFTEAPLRHADCIESESGQATVARRQRVLN